MTEEEVMMITKEEEDLINWGVPMLFDKFLMENRKSLVDLWINYWFDDGTISISMCKYCWNVFIEHSGNKPEWNACCDTSECIEKHNKDAHGYTTDELQNIIEDENGTYNALFEEMNELREKLSDARGKISDAREKLKLSELEYINLRASANEIVLPFFDENAVGYVYLVDGGNGLFKIGMTTNIVSRLKSIQAQSPISLKIAHIIPCSNYQEVEVYLHKKYQSTRRHYEWFALSEEQVSEIKTISSGDQPPAHQRIML